MSPIKGLHKVSLIDFPQNIAAVIFLGGCNFKCSYCHNPELVLKPAKQPSFNQKEILQYLEKRKNLLDGVVITGGEPTLHKDFLLEFLPKIKRLGLKIKLDTNGSLPQNLKEIIPLTDYIAMDIKTSFEKYNEITNTKVNIQKIKESIEIIKKSGKDYEFRTTLMPSLVTKKDIQKITKEIKGAKKYTLQQLRKEKKMIHNKVKQETIYTKEDILQIKKLAKNEVLEVEIKNI